MSKRKPFEPLYIDNHLMVVNKPAGILAQADETGDPDILTLGKAYLKKRFGKPGKVYLGLVHRLDRPVSGVMVLARTSKAAARLTEMFRERQVEKRYLAVVEGQISGTDHWRDYLLKDGRKVRTVAADHPKGKEARLSWQAIDTGASTSLVEVALHTGRPHQIRLQFASRGYPLVGDLRYDAKTRFDGINLALHSYSLGITHPTRREPMSFVVRPPQSWRGFHEKARNAFFETCGD